MKGNCKSKRIRWDKVLLSMVLWHLAFYLVGCVAKEEESRYPEVEKYLFDRFEVLGKYSGNYYIEEISENGEVYYRVTEKEGEKLEFRVFPVGDEYTKAGFDDTCPVAFVMKKAGETGLVLEPGEREKELIATVDGYEELGALAEKLAQIADAYEKAGLPAKFTTGTVGDGWNSANIRVEIRGFAPEGYQPGIIRIPDSVTGFHDKESMQWYLETNYLTFLERYVLEEIPAGIPKEAFQEIRGDASGITVINGEETREYPELDYHHLYFAEVYRLAKREGWEPVADENGFTIARGEENYRFELVFEEREDIKNQEKYKYSGSWEPLGHAAGQEPVVYCFMAGGEEKMPASSDYTADKGGISVDILEQITGTTIESGLKLQDAQERIQEIQEEADGYLLRSDAKALGESVEIAGWRITLNQVEEKKRLETSSMYYEADEGKIFVRLNMEVENLGTEKAPFLKTIVTGDDLLIHLVSSGGHRYIPVDLIGMSDLTSASVEPNGVESGGLIFHIAEDILQQDEHIFLVFKAGEESRLFRIK